MRLSRLLVALGTAAVVAACARAQSSAVPSPAAGDRPRLVVLLVVDQLREPLLERYDDLFTGGLRRLLDEGRFYTRATHDHGTTVTAAGHATLATGSFPSHHGIIGNEWSERVPGGWQTVSNVGDSTVRIVGEPTAPGVSPHYLQRTGIADWIAAADPRAIVASISLKDRGAVLPAGRTKGQVYWFDAGAGRFVTSTWYRDAYPEWVTRYNDEAAARVRTDTVWTSTIPAAALARTLPDTMASENDGKRTFFPHRLSEEVGRDGFWGWYDGTPMLDALAVGMAQRAVTSLGLGRDDIPDYLNLSLSQTDRIGHAYGPHSREMLDQLLRLDRELGRFLSFLDANVGRGRWVVALSADHGSVVPPEGETRTTTEEPLAHRATPAESRAIAQARSVGGPPAAIVAALKQLPFVADAWTFERLERGLPADSFEVLARRSRYDGRVEGEFGKLGVVVRYTEGFLTSPRGTSHGRPYWYDRHVPVIFLGAGIAAGKDTTRASTTDVAPTLARLAKVTPGVVDGRVLGGVVAKPEN